MALTSPPGDSAAVVRADLCAGAALLFVDLDLGRRILLALRDRLRAAGNLRGAAHVLAMIGSGLGELMHLAKAGPA